jgi:hypothetical protein
VRREDREPVAAVVLDVSGTILTVSGVFTLIVGLAVACAGCDRVVRSSVADDAFVAAMFGAAAVSLGAVFFLVGAGFHFDARSRREHAFGRISLAPGPGDLGLALVLALD